MDVFCADIGSPLNGNSFGWFGRLATGAELSGDCLPRLAGAVSEQLNAGSQVSLGIEAPIFVPFRRDWVDLTRPRAGERDKNWIGGPGSSVLATALVQVAWLLRHVRADVDDSIVATLDWNQFERQEAQFLLWEAFVSGAAKAEDGTHIGDARRAVNRFLACMPDPTEHNEIHEETVYSLIGAALLRTGWSDDLRLLATPSFVLRPEDRPSTGQASPSTVQARRNESGNQCPECEKVFNGTGWGGIDAHWKSKHEHIMPYAEAWPLIKAGAYRSNRG